VPHSSLSARELKLLELVAEGKSNRDISAALFIGDSTIRDDIAQHPRETSGWRTAWDRERPRAVRRVRRQHRSLWHGSSSAPADLVKPRQPAIPSKSTGEGAFEPHAPERDIRAVGSAASHPGGRWCESG
jgi:hypothetical protein